MTNKIKRLSIQPSLSLVDIAFFAMLTILACTVSYYIGYDNSQRVRAMEARLSVICEAQGWTPELEEMCEEY